MHLTCPPKVQCFGLTQYGMEAILAHGVATVIEGDLEWDEATARSNLQNHGVSLRDRVLCVVHVERGRRDRIMSARHASRAEREVYESGEHQ